MRSGTNDAALLSQLFEFLIPHRPGLFSQANFCCTHAPLDDQLPFCKERFGIFQIIERKRLTRPRT